MSSATRSRGRPRLRGVALEKYNLPGGTNADAIARDVRLRTAVSSAEKPRGDPAGGDRSGSFRRGARGRVRAQEPRGSRGGEPVARVSWSPASPGGPRASRTAVTRARFWRPPAGPARADSGPARRQRGGRAVRASARRALPRPGTARRSRGEPRAGEPRGASAARLAHPVRERGAPGIGERRRDVHLRETDAADHEGDHGPWRAPVRGARGDARASCGTRVAGRAGLEESGRVRLPRAASALSAASARVPPGRRA